MKRIVCLFVTVAAYGQQSQQGAKELADLVSEVRELKLIVQRSLAAATESQIVIQRLMIQQGRVDRLKSDAEKASAAVTGMQAAQTHTVELMRRSEAELQSANVQPGRKESLAHDVAAYKARLAQESSRESELRAAETRAVTEYRTALSQLTELEDRLMQIQRATTASNTSK